MKPLNIINTIKSLKCLLSKFAIRDVKIIPERGW